MNSRSDRFAARLLRQEVVQSTGCTEPVAIALAAAAASKLAGGDPQRVRVEADIGTFKNSLAVGLPGTSCRGPEVVAAAGALLATPERRLRLFEDGTASLWRRAVELVDDGRVEVRPDSRVPGIRIEAWVEGCEGEGAAIIADRHDRIFELRRNGRVEEDEGRAAAAAGVADISDEEIRRRLRSPRAILACHAELEPGDLEDIRQGVVLNLAVAERSLAEGLGLGFGRALLDLGDAEYADPSRAVKAWVGAGVEARMAGVPLPVMTSGGSGNSGLTVTLGVWSAAKCLGVESPDRMAGAVALAHLFNVAVKSRIGRVGPLCGGTIGSSLGVGCGIAWMLGGEADALDRVVRHMANAVTGTVCDGAKPACALKIAAGLGVAVDAALLSVGGGGEVGVSGIGGGSAGEVFDRLHRLAVEAYRDVDPVLTAILSDQAPISLGGLPNTGQER